MRCLKEETDSLAPVEHDEAFIATVLADADTKFAYDQLKEEYAAIQAVLRAGLEARSVT
ncbi:hypothetical protein [Ferriphaselus sp. R-1]|uniref:hypothetical protein n=1 Tax=Ferriphaselus sp. R-1 TaxID=1485544 RepID=UPI001F192C98|nr:hypothetical protein [Ferriphaselus sp. R-1]